ncbi:tetratricopeptide repeat-containing sensor histidine kinase [Pedobacter frigoris]|uniref:tetratricopeptide repeat-containing sensor histidine kinase n=1 Tax=Pedobacter frigoris TaxID=2571272 RepID=UPI002930284A|nr:tetratricopeptide repeat-containing sensor histidine kinase [Pedobacter frigoris]
MLHYLNYKMIGRLILVSCLICTLLPGCQRSHTQNPDHPPVTDSIIDRANTLLNTGRINDALFHIDSAYSKLQNPGPIDLWKKYSFKNNFYLNYQITPEKANLYVDSMFTVLKGYESAHKNIYAQTIFAKGDVLRASKSFDEAFENYYKGLEYAEKNLDTCLFTNFSNRLGLIRYAQEEFLNAIPYFKKALNENSHCTCSDFAEQFAIPQSIYNNIALSFEQAEKPDSASHYYLKASEFIDKRSKRFPEKIVFIETSKGVIYGNLGGLYAQQHQYAEAEKYLKASIKINDRPGYAVEDAQTAKLKLANLYLDLNRLKEADNMISELETDLSSREGSNNENSHMLKFIYDLKSRYFNKKNDPQNAYLYLVKYNAINDSLNAEISGLKNVDIDAAFRHSEQQHKLNLVSRDNQLKTFYLIAAIVFIILTVSLMFTARANLKRSHSNVEKLTALNKRITDQNEQMHLTLAILEQSQAENTRMMKIVAHDLRTPIGAIKMVASLMLQKSILSDDDRELLDMVKRSSKDCLNLVSEMLQPTQSPEQLEKEPEELDKMLGYCVEQLKLKAEGKNQQITLQTVQLLAPINNEKLWRVMSNLITNAIKFSPDNTTIQISLIKKENNALISVKDQGIGIPDEIKTKIFNQFSEAQRKGTAGEQTFGLGLSISTQIVNAHGGKIWFENNLDKGVTFYVELPL